MKNIGLVFSNTCNGLRQTWWFQLTCPWWLIEGRGKTLPNIEPVLRTIFAESKKENSDSVTVQLINEVQDFFKTKYQQLHEISK